MHPCQLPNSATTQGLLLHSRFTFKSASSSDSKTSIRSAGSCWKWGLHHYCVKCSFVWHFQLCRLKVSWKWIETRWGGNKRVFSWHQKCGCPSVPQCDKEMMDDLLCIYEKTPNGFYLSDFLIFTHLTVIVLERQTLSGNDRRAFHSHVSVL